MRKTLLFLFFTTLLTLSAIGCSDEVNPDAPKAPEPGSAEYESYSSGANHGGGAGRGGGASRGGHGR